VFVHCKVDRYRYLKLSNCLLQNILQVLLDEPRALGNLTGTKIALYPSLGDVATRIADTVLID